jgi:hypothetical protein
MVPLDLRVRLLESSHIARFGYDVAVFKTPSRANSLHVKGQTERIVTMTPEPPTCVYSAYLFTGPEMHRSANPPIHYGNNPAKRV